MTDEYWMLLAETLRRIEAVGRATADAERLRQAAESVPAIGEPEPRGEGEPCR